MSIPEIRSFVLRRLRLALALALLGQSVAHAQEVSEYGVKAVLFYRLTQFVYWPADNKPPTPQTLCVVGRNPFGTAFAQTDQNVATVETRSNGDLGNCQLVFIPRSEAGNLDSWLSRLDSRRLVSVSDIPGFARAGGMIELPLEGGRVAIVINRRSAQKKGFEFNAQLLRLARVIEP